MTKEKAEQKVVGESDELVIVRVLDAPRELVWQAWSEAGRLAQWWGPKGCSVEVAKLDFRPGGVFHYKINLPEDCFLWGKFVYREIAPTELLAYVSSFADESGNVVRAPFSPIFPLEILNTVTFTGSGDKTTLTLRGGPINASAEERAAFAAMRADMQKGFGGMLDVFDEYLAKG